MDDDEDPHTIARSYQERAARDREVFKSMFTESPSFTLGPTAEDYPIFAVKTKVRKIRALAIKSLINRKGGI